MRQELKEIKMKLELKNWSVSPMIKSKKEAHMTSFTQMRILRLPGQRNPRSLSIGRYRR